MVHEDDDDRNPGDQDGKDDGGEGKIKETRHQQASHSKHDHKNRAASSSSELLSPPSSAKRDRLRNRSRSKERSRSRDRGSNRSSRRTYRDVHRRKSPGSRYHKYESHRYESGRSHTGSRRIDSSDEESYQIRRRASWRAGRESGLRGRRSGTARRDRSSSLHSSRSSVDSVYRARSLSSSEHSRDRRYRGRSSRSRSRRSYSSSSSVSPRRSVHVKYRESSSKQFRPNMGTSTRSGSKAEDEADSNPMSRRGAPHATEYERSKRTIFVSQLALSITTKDLHKFFEQAGRVHNARIISDRNSRRSKGVGYVEFYDEESVPQALSMSGQVLHGQQIVTWKTDAERLSSSSAIANQSKIDFSTRRLYVGHLDNTVTEEMLYSLFSSFGPLKSVNLHLDLVTGLSSGFAFIKFANHADCKLAAERLNGYVFNGSAIKVTPTVDKPCLPNYDDGFDDKDSEGFTMSSLSRIDLMAKLARNKLPFGISNIRKPETPSTRNVLLKNMFSQQIKSEENWAEDLRDDVKAECSKYGKLLHVGVDENSTDGSVYLKFDAISEAENAQKALNGRFFACCKVKA